MSVNAIWALVIVVLVCFIGAAAVFTLQREHEMDLRCEQAPGPGSSFAGWGQCYPPKVAVEGVGQ